MHGNHAKRCLSSIDVGRVTSNHNHHRNGDIQHNINFSSNRTVRKKKLKF